MRYKVPIKELEFSYSKSSGAGGQNVNKLNTRVTLSWNLKKSNALPEDVQRRFTAKFPRIISNDGEVQISSQRFRSQGRNLADCIEKLHSMIEQVESPPKKRKATRPKKSAVERRIKDKKALGEKKRHRRETF